MKMSIGMLRQMIRTTMTALSLGAPYQDNRERRDLLCCIIDAVAGTAEVTLVMGSRPSGRKILVQEGTYVIGQRQLTRPFDHLQAPAARNRGEPTSAPPFGKRHRGCRNVRPGSFASILPRPVHVRFTPNSDRIADNPETAASCHKPTSSGWAVCLSVHKFYIGHFERLAPEGFLRTIEPQPDVGFFARRRNPVGFQTGRRVRPEI